MLGKTYAERLPTGASSRISFYCSRKSMCSAVMSVLKDLLRFAEICWPQLRYFISTSEFEDRRQRNAYLNIGCKQKLRIAVNDNLGIEPTETV